MRRIKKGIAVALSLVLALSLTACGTKKSAEKNDKLVIAYQNGLSYTPLLVMKEKKLIEKHYGKDVNVDWKLLASGAAISEGITADSIDIGAIGTSVAINGIMSKTPYKICTGLAAVSCGIQTNDSSIKTLKDIKSSDQIVVTQVNSQPNILLAMAAKKELGDAHALDANLVAMANADGYSALISGAVQCNMVLAPYNLMEVKAVTKAFPISPNDGNKISGQIFKVYNTCHKIRTETIKIIFTKLFLIFLFKTILL